MQQLAAYFMDPKKILIPDFDYHLPENKIAKYPLPERDASRLLIYRDGKINESIFSSIAHYLPDNSFMVSNNSKVIEARIRFQKATGGVIEIFCLEPGGPDSNISSAITKTKTVFWKCLVGGASKWKYGQVLHKEIILNNQPILLSATITEKLSNCFIIHFSWAPENFSFAEIIHQFGITPLPPYIKRMPEMIDHERYQTIYALSDGSVAAPTAGLHFTHQIFQDLAKKDIRQEQITLHVGAGTFKPIMNETLKDHEMHAELIEVNASTISAIVDHMDQTIIAVGTTSLRALESLYWMGVKTVLNPKINVENLIVLQWDAYELKAENISATESLRSLLLWLKMNDLERVISKTQLLIVPSYQLKIVNILITNFHQPKSSLLLLVAAFIGDDWSKVYEYALKNEFRFLSYGDACLLFCNNS